MTSGFDFTKKVPPFTGKDWKPRQRKRSPMSLCGTAALITPSPHCAGREGNKVFYYISQIGNLGLTVPPSVYLMLTDSYVNTLPNQGLIPYTICVRVQIYFAELSRKTKTRIWKRSFPKLVLPGIEPGTFITVLTVAFF